MFKSRLKEKRLKVKKRLRAEMGLENGDKDGAEEEEIGVVLGTPSERSGASEDSGGVDSGEESGDDGREESESIEEIPLRKKR